MKIVAADATALEVPAEKLDRGDHYEFPCGCRFPVAAGLPDVHGLHKPLVYDVQNASLECPATWGLIGSGHTKGIFQLESSLGKHWAKRLKPENIHQLAALTAILRPGTLKSKDEDGTSMTEVYCRRKNGEEPGWEEKVLPALRPALERTYGVLVYQESSMQIAKDLAGFDLQEADQLRKCVTGDTRFVSKTRGWITIDRLMKEGYKDDLFLVMDASGKQAWKRLDKIWSTGKHDAVEVVSESGASVWATHYHRFLTASGWKARARLAVGDPLIATREISYDGEDRITRDLAVVISGIVAEGTFHDHIRKVSRFTNFDPFMMGEFVSAFERTFGVDTLNRPEDGRVVHLRKAQREALEPYINYGKSDSRRLPEEMMGMTESSTADFLSYLLACEGGITESSGAFEFSSKSPTLAAQVKLLLLRFGIRSLLLKYPEKARFRLYVTDVTEQRRLLARLTHMWPQEKRDALAARIDRKAGYTTDTFPQCVVGRMIDEHPYVGNGESGTLYTADISRDRFRRVAGKTGDPVWIDLADGRQCYEPVKSLESRRKATQTFDFTVAGGDTPYIVANGLVIHNSIGKKDTALMAKVKAMFLEKAGAAGVVDSETAEAVFANIEKSQRYAFNSSHAYAYGMNTYWSAHAKAHFPLYFFTSYLFWAKEKSDPLKEIRQVINDGKHFGIEVLPPRFAELRHHFGTDGVQITFGLADARGVGDKAVDKMRENAPPKETLLTWSWYDFLTLFSGHCGAGVVRRMIEVGAMRDMGGHRTRLLAEFDAWDRLTEKEQEGVAGLGLPLYKKVAVKREVEYEVEEPVYDKAAMKEYKKACKEWAKCDQADIPEGPTKPEMPPAIGTVVKKKTKMVSSKGEDGSVLYETTDELLDGPRPAHDLEGALEALLARPGAVTTARREKVASLLTLLREPPSPLVDTPYWVAKKEEEGLGIPVTVSHVDSADTSIVNCSVKDYLAGWSPRGRDEMTVLGVEVQEVFEITIKNGENRGRKMGRLCVADDSGVLEDCVAFADAWEQYAHALYREHTVVALGGKRSWREGENTFIIERVWEI